MHLLLTVSLLLILPLTHAHMEMLSPLALRSKYDPINQKSQNIDYSNTSPLLATGANYPCKGYQNDLPKRSTATYTAGNNHTLKLAGATMHMGGSCQLSLSYDNGKTFRVIQSLIGGCPLEKSWEFEMPKYAPVGKALFAWTWVNLVGNREFYMNCAWVRIVAKKKKNHARDLSDYERHNHAHPFQNARRATTSVKKYSDFADLPFLWKANLASENECKTVEAKEVVYPHPGPDVIYGDGMSARSLVTHGMCNKPGPPGPMYRKAVDEDAADGVDMGDETSGSSSSGGGSGSSSSKSPAAPTRIPQPFPAHAARLIYPLYPFRNASTSSTSTTSTPSNTSTTNTSHFSTSSTTSSPTTSSTTTTTSLSSSSSATSSPSPSSSIAPSPHTPPNPNNPNPPFASPTPNNPSYLPCLPGTFLCLTPSTWAQCVPSPSTTPQTPDGTYTAMGAVALGMECVPWSTANGPDLAQSQNAHDALSAGGGEAGSHRDDRIVRAAEAGLGHCEARDEGRVGCLRGGEGWEICAQGAWVDMGAVARGTRCVGDGGVVSV